MRQDHVLKCPDCQSIVPIDDDAVDGLAAEGGHGTVGVKSRATCTKCGRVFMKVEIEILEFWK